MMKNLKDSSVGYQMPAPELAALVDATPIPSVAMDRKGRYMLLLQRSELPSIEELAKPELKLAGLRIDPVTYGPSRAGYVTGISIQDLENKCELDLKGMPANALLSNIKWAPDDTKIAFTITSEEGIHLYYANLQDRLVKRVSKYALNATLSTPYFWLSDSESFILLTVPEERGTAPVTSHQSIAPVIQNNTDGRKQITPTFQDLLKSVHDEELLIYYCTSQIVKVTIEGEENKISTPQLYADAEPSPDGRYILAQFLKQPFSYLVPARLFPLETRLVALETKEEQVLFDRPLVESMLWSQDATLAGKRGFSWRSDCRATLSWVEALDNGDPKKEVAERDALFIQDISEGLEPACIFTTPYRFAGVYWGTENCAVVYERWWESRRSRKQVIDPSAASQPEILFERSLEDAYNHPGSPEVVKNSWGRLVLKLTDKHELFLLGIGASEAGNIPFVDKYNLKEKTTIRLWQSKAPYYEVPVAILEDDKLLFTREGIQEVPNYFLTNLYETDKQQQLTFFSHPYPHLKGVVKEQLVYKREDGVELRANLYLPQGYEITQGKLPALFWAYPKEFKAKDTAGQNTSSPYQFNRISYHGALAFVARGYAVLDQVAFPIIGEGDKEPNDSYVEQLVMSAKAAVDAAEATGKIDRDRIAVAGHSYGAFMVANLLTHTSFFRAGIARSGAYNRTLTPFGFQNETRSFWEAKEVYSNMSPFVHADKMKTPILLIHGEADSNIGTFPLQSERYYAALKSLGAPARLVMLPYEGHGYAARESIMHVLWETDEWLRNYLFVE